MDEQLGGLCADCPGRDRTRARRFVARRADQGSEIYMYADDTKIFNYISEADDCRRLQQDLENVQRWTDDWQLKFTQKSVVTWDLDTYMWMT